MHALGAGIAILLAILICAGGAAIAIFRKYKVSQSKFALVLKRKNIQRKNIIENIAKVRLKSDQKFPSEI